MFAELKRIIKSFIPGTTHTRCGAESPPPALRSEDCEVSGRGGCGVIKCGDRAAKACTSAAGSGPSL